MASVRRRHASKPSSWIIEVTDVDDAGSLGSPPDRLGIDALCHLASIERLADPGEGGLPRRRRLLARLGTALGTYESLYFPSREP